MIRHASAIAVALCLNASWVCAQNTKFTVSAASADVHKSPSTGGPVIGHAPRGTVLEVTRELGSWVKVAWPAEDGVGYVHVSMGLIARGSTLAPSPPAGFTPQQPAIEPARPPAPAARPAPIEPGGPPAPTRTGYVTPTHSVGVGGVMAGPTLGFGATARAWSSKRFGIQFEVSRDAVTDASGQLTSSQFTPSLLYSLRDRVTDYLWVRPYLGAGPSLQHQTLNGASAGGTDSVSDTRLGFHAFGGGEITFPSMPRFAVSADLGYRWRPTSFAGFELGGLSLSLSGHWYIK